MGFPLVFVFSGRASTLFSALPSVLLGKKTWIGYEVPDEQVNTLPSLKEGIVQLSDLADGNGHIEEVHASNLWYAKNFTSWTEAADLAKIYFGTGKKK